MRSRYRAGPRRTQGLGDGADLLIDAGWCGIPKLHCSVLAPSPITHLLARGAAPPDDYDGYRKLAEATHVRIAAGEEESNRSRSSS